MTQFHEMDLCSTAGLRERLQGQQIFISSSSWVIFVYWPQNNMILSGLPFKIQMWKIKASSVSTSSLTLIIYKNYFSLSLSPLFTLCCLSPSWFCSLPSLTSPPSLKLAGAAILAVGVWVKVDSSSFLGILDDVEGVPAELSQLVNISYLLIALGAVLLVIGFLGCCGAIKESRCMLLTVRLFSPSRRGNQSCHFLWSCGFVVTFGRTLTTRQYNDLTADEVTK